MVDYVKTEGKTVASKTAYADLDLTFKAHPITGDVTLRKDSDAIRRAVSNIIQTNKYERPFKPNFGGSVRDMLFELDTDSKVKRMKRALTEQIENFEPRVTGVEVVLGDVVENRIPVTVFYRIINGLKTQQLDFTIRRVR